MTIFSQYGEPVHVNLVRDKETGKSRGFAFLKYEDQRSTDLAVDNMGGATVLGRILRVDHTRYKRRDDEDEDDNVAKLMGDAAISESKTEETPGSRSHRKRRSIDADIDERRPMLKEEQELQELIQNHDDEDPMKEFLIDEKKEEVARAIQTYRSSEKRSSRRRDDSKERSSRYHRRRRSRSHGRRHRDDRSPDRERRARRRSTERDEKSRRYRSLERSRSPDSRKPQSDRDRHDRRRR